MIDNLAKEANLTEYTVNFLNILIDQDRLVEAEEIFQAFEDAYCELTDTQASP